MAIALLGCCVACGPSVGEAESSGGQGGSQSSSGAAASDAPSTGDVGSTTDNREVLDIGGGPIADPCGTDELGCVGVVESKLGLPVTEAGAFVDADGEVYVRLEDSTDDYRYEVWFALPQASTYPIPFEGLPYWGSYSSPADWEWWIGETSGELDGNVQRLDTVDGCVVFDISEARSAQEGFETPPEGIYVIPPTALPDGCDIPDPG